MSRHAEQEEPVNVQVTLKLKPSLLSQVEQLRHEWGLSSRADVIERLLGEVFEPLE